MKIRCFLELLWDVIGKPRDTLLIGLSACHKFRKSWILGIA